jgi:hypothetical protein
LESFDTELFSSGPGAACTSSLVIVAFENDQEFTS